MWKEWYDRIHSIYKTVSKKYPKTYYSQQDYNVYIQWTLKYPRIVVNGSEAKQRMLVDGRCSKSGLQLCYTH